jgi:hypothetical protein
MLFIKGIIVSLVSPRRNEPDVSFSFVSQSHWTSIQETMMSPGISVREKISKYPRSFRNFQIQNTSPISSQTYP